MTNTAGKSMAVAALFAAIATMSAGCGADDGHPRATAPAPAAAPVRAPATSATSAAPLRLTLSDLAQHPCRALGEKQMTDLLVIDRQHQEGGEQETGFRQCRWWTARGWLLFASHPSVDMTTDPEVAQLEPGELDGHRTMLGVDPARDRCMMYVAVAGQQSFQVAIYPQEGQHLGMSGCDVIKQLASKVLDNLS